MSEFKCTVERIEIFEHPNADALELGRIIGKDYKVVVAKGLYKTGDWIVYIPEQAIVPDWLITKLNLEDKLAGKAKNRVKAVKLRQQLSQGLTVPLESTYDGMVLSNNENEARYVHLYDDVTSFLGIEKWEPPIPIHMEGEVENNYGKTLGYDIENYKNYPAVLEEGEMVVYSEKLHGTLCAIGWHNSVGFMAYSKRLGSSGLSFKLNENNEKNIYVKNYLRNQETFENIWDVLPELKDYDAFYIFGEIFGERIQDLGYAQKKPSFRIFDIFVGLPLEGRYLDYETMKEWTHRLGFETVPELYKGPFSVDTMYEYTRGKETVSGKEQHIREGIVIKPLKERFDFDLGRVILKSISEDYLLRKGKITEYN